jgi:transcriptional regulator with XRE-family HTH domain
MEVFLVMSTVGKNILARRKELGMTQGDLAAKMGYKSKSTINKIELGINDIPQAKVMRFAEALQTTPAKLMGLEEQIKKEPVQMAQLHFEMVMDEDLTEIFKSLQFLDARERKIVKDLAHSLAETKKAEV